ncbi:molybdopterin-dependent oxidoreductase [Lutibacter sp.]|uniref:molybdopterin-dependent oxidoreductase n=1 Tax=Lutibacter sp. TaxID=1925666 RepID=UPI002737385E|nr:molybdopterin-dependent oxidoreductase [Lutibacter sp.]MDP3314023.1 molybdopterin-dependent oxidoreductase [Lutibacter sp.]
MGYKKPSFIENIAEKLGIIPNLHKEGYQEFDKDMRQFTDEEVAKMYENFPPPEKWDNWVEYNPKVWPKKEKKTYQIVPTTCFNCESACGLTAFIDKETQEVKKFEGNPYHPGSRGRNCAKGPATINQVTDPDRILFPLKRKGKRGDGEWERVSWDDALDTIATRIRKAILEDRHNEIAYHVGRPGNENFMNWILQGWGIDGHNSHTNICSSGARFGYNLWYGYDRPSPDHAEAKFILLISAHLESGHYFNPHAQRIIEGKMKGAKLATMDPRLSNTASMSDYWLPSYPGTEAAVLLAIALIILEEGLYNRAYLENWTNWQEYLKARHSDKEITFENYIASMIAEYKEFTPEYAEKESGVKADMIIEIARKIGEAGERFASHNWRAAGASNLGGWAVARCLHFLTVLTGAVGAKGGTSPNSWNKFKPTQPNPPAPQKKWNELHFPKEYPLAFFEMSQLLPHFLKEGRGKLDMYFSRVFNPVWTYPDGFTWMEMLTDETKFGMHAALTPTWNETAFFADFVLPMGLASERHDINSYATHGGTWVAFRQPVLREAARRNGKPVKLTYEANPGEVWEEDEFFIELSWRIDPDGSMGIRKTFESPYRLGEKITIDEYYQYIFERVKGLNEVAKTDGFTGQFAALEYMKKYGAYEIEKGESYKMNEKLLTEEQLKGSIVDPKNDVISKDGKGIGVMINGNPCVGFPTPSRKNEFYSQTMVDWKWPEYATPTYIKSHIHNDVLDKSKGEYVLVPTFRLPTLIHSRSGNAKWLVEISNRNPIWMHPDDAKKWGFQTGDLVKLNTDIGYFIDKVWVTQSMKPGVVACSHHIGRWRRPQDQTGNRWATNTVNIESDGKGAWRMNTISGIKPFESSDKDSKRIFWKDGGVHQNITHAVHPDPISGMHTWHQRVRIEKPKEGENYGDIFVDTNKSHEIYKEWLSMTRPAPGPNGERRPFWFARAFRPDDSTYYLKPTNNGSE